MIKEKFFKIGSLLLQVRWSSDGWQTTSVTGRFVSYFFMIGSSTHKGYPGIQTYELMIWKFATAMTIIPRSHK